MKRKPFLLCITLLGFSGLCAEVPPFDAPKELQSTSPTVEIISAQLASTEEFSAPSVNEDFQTLPEMQEEEESTILVAPDPILTPILLAPAEKEIFSQMDKKSTENVTEPLRAKLSVHPEKKPAASDAAIAEESPIFPAARTETPHTSGHVNMREVFAGAPWIYSVLLAISMVTVALWLFTLMNMRTEKLMPPEMLAGLQEKMSAGNVGEALALCQGSTSLLGCMVRSGLQAEHKNKMEMLNMMESEGKRSSGRFWRRLALLNDVAIVAPMIGLLGTVIGMFYAFYDINRSLESMNSLFDGLGISVGTTVAGLLLAIVALVLHSTSKYRLVKQLTRVESTASILVSKLYEEKRS